MKLRLLFSLCAFCVALLAGADVQNIHARETLIVYTAIEQERLPLYKKAFEAAYPDIAIQWQRESSGTLTARILAEKDAPRADVVFGLSASSLLILKSMGMLEPYRPQGFDNIIPSMRDADAAPCWTGMDAWATAFTVNRPEMAKRGLTLPGTWEDLLRPEYKDSIVMPDPAASGTGYMNLVAWIAAWGEEKAWAYADALNAQVKMLSPSGPRPAVMAAQGEVLVGVSSASFCKPLLRRRAPLEIIVPPQTGWEVEASAIIKGTKKLAAAQKMLDFTCSDAVARLGVAFSGMAAHKDHMADTALLKKLAPIDLQWAADNRERLLKTWRQRYSR